MIMQGMHVLKAHNGMSDGNNISKLRSQVSRRHGSQKPAQAANKGILLCAILTLRINESLLEALVNRVKLQQYLCNGKMWVIPWKNYGIWLTHIQFCRRQNIGCTEENERTVRA